MKRRDFLMTSCLAGLAASDSKAADGDKSTGRDYFELQKYTIETPAQKDLLDAFFRDAAIPALNRIDIKPVGVFHPIEDLGPVYVLLSHKSLQSFGETPQKLLQDEQFVQSGAPVLDAQATAPAYKRIEVSLMRGFDGMPRLETPVSEPSRIFQLRIYESASIMAGQKKIEMFNTAEIKIFRKTGLHPVFFGQNLAGPVMPNLTYMLAFRDMDESKANWKQFGGDPEWQKLRAMPEYADKKIVSNIANIYLKPASYSQI